MVILTDIPTLLFSTAGYWVWKTAQVITTLSGKDLAIEYAYHVAGHPDKPCRSVSEAIDRYKATALVLHPNWGVRDPYGVMTHEMLVVCYRLVQAFYEGFARAEELTGYPRQRSALYSEVRYFIRTSWDLPPELVSQLALHATSGDGPYQPVL